MTISLNNLTSTPAVDVVAVYDVNFNQVFFGARPIKLALKEEAIFFKQPLEDSTVRTDHIIFSPVEAILTAILTGDQYRDVYKQVKQLFTSQTQLIVQTKVETYENMYIQSMPHNEDASLYDAIIMNISIMETLVAGSTSTFQPANESDSTTVDRGQQEATTATESQENQGTLLLRIFS